MNNTPLISLVVPIYNVELYLSRCLDSIIGQTYTNLEIILVNDGSTDRCLDICKTYAEQDNRIAIIDKDNGGLSDARNAGINFAHGEYIGFIDPDDWIEQDMYEYLLSGIKKHNADISVCGYFDVWDNTAKAVLRNPERVYRSSSATRALLNLKISNYAWNKLYKKELWDTGIRYPKGKKYEDVRTTYRLFEIANAVASLPEPKYYYLRRKTGITGTTNISNMCECVESRMARYEAISSKYPDVKVFLLREIARYTNQLCESIAKHPKKEFDINKEKIEYISSFIRTHQEDFYKAHKWRKPKQISFSLLGSPKRENWLRFYGLEKAAKNLKGLKKGHLYTKAATLAKQEKASSRLVLYHHYLGKPICSQQAFVESRAGEDLAGNMLRIVEELVTRDYAVTISAKNKFKHKIELILDTRSLKDSVQIADKDSDEYYQALATSKYLFNDMVFPDCFVKRNDQIYTNTWHGTPLKTLEYDTVNQRHALGGGVRDRVKTDYLAVPNIFLFEKLLESSHTDQLYLGKAALSGYPRNEVFFDFEAQASLRNQLGLNNREIFVYMPTWRGTQEKHITQSDEYSTQSILEYFDTHLSENQILFAKLHNYAEETIDYSGYSQVRPFPSEFDTYCFLSIADCLITDYSSVFFDFANTRRKIVLFAFDLEEYRIDRGLYLDIDALPFPCVQDYEDLAKELNTTKRYNDEDFVATYCTFDRQDATNVLLDLVIDGLDNCATITADKNGKDNVLIYDEWNHQRYAFPDKIPAMLNDLDVSRANYYYGIRQWGSPKTPDFLEHLPNGIRLYSLSKESMISKNESRLLAKTNKPHISLAREYNREFGFASFDAIYVIGDNPDDVFGRLLRAHPNYHPGGIIKK